MDPHGTVCNTPTTVRIPARLHPYKQTIYWSGNLEHEAIPPGDCADVALPMAVKYVVGASTLRSPRNQSALPPATISSDLRGVPRGVGVRDSRLFNRVARGTSLSVIEDRRLLCHRASTPLETHKHAAITRYPPQRYCRVSISGFPSPVSPTS